MQKVVIDVKNYSLQGTVFSPQGKKRNNNPAILFVYGWTGEMRRNFQYAKSLSNLGYVCCLFDMRGHGISEGDRNTLSSKDLLDDVLAAYDYFSTLKEVDTNNISVISSSFGGYLAAILATKRRVKNLVLRAPADYAKETFEKLKSENTGDKVVGWRKQKRDFNESFALGGMHTFNGDVLILESEKDAQIPHRTIQNYIDNAKDKSKLTHTLIKGAPHSIRKGKFRDRVEKILLNWFEIRI